MQRIARSVGHPFAILFYVNCVALFDVCIFITNPSIKGTKQGWFYVLWIVLTSNCPHLSKRQKLQIPIVQVSLPWTSCGNPWNNNLTCTIPSKVEIITITITIIMHAKVGVNDS